MASKSRGSAHDAQNNARLIYSGNLLIKAEVKNLFKQKPEHCGGRNASPTMSPRADIALAQNGKNPKEFKEHVDAVRYRLFVFIILDSLLELFGATIDCDDRSRNTRSLEGQQSPPLDTV